MEHNINTEIKQVVKMVEEKVIKSISLHVSKEELDHLVSAMGHRTSGFSLYQKLKDVQKTVQGGVK